MITKIIEQLTTFLWGSDVITLELWQTSLTEIFAVALTVTVFIFLCRAVIGIFRTVFKWF